MTSRIRLFLVAIAFSVFGQGCAALGSADAPKTGPAPVVIAAPVRMATTAPVSTWLSSSWPYRSAITVANPGGTTLSNYQVHVVLGTSFDFTKAQAKGADIRFTASDGVTALPFWIESWNAATSSASLWVKVPTVDAVNGATLYMYYGNSTAASASNGNTTFDFFDDFSSGLIDTTKWTSSGGTWSVVTGTEPNGLTGTIARGSTVRPPNEILYSSAYTAGDYIFEVNGLQQSGRHWGIAARVNGPSNFYSANLYDDLNTSNNLYEYKWLNNNGNNLAIQLGNTAVGAINLNTWYKLRMAVHGSSIDVYLNDVLKLQTSDTQWATGGVALFGGESMVANFAYVRTRQFAATEPTVSVGPGTASSSSSSVVVSSLTLNPTSVIGGNSSQGTVTLSGPAPSGGAVITLSSSATAAAQVPASVTVAANATSAVFTITTAGVTTQTTANITGSYNSSSQTAPLTIAAVSGTYRSAITVGNPGGTTLNNYQVHVVLGASFDFTKTQANGADIRFTASDGVTALPFWIESWNAATSSASLWVKVPTIDAVNGATLYMYYGNSTAASASNGNTTFDFFDDFSSGSIDATKWTSSAGTWSVVTGTEPNGLTGTIARGSTVRPPNEILYSSAYTAGDYIFEVNGLEQSGRHWGIAARVNGPSNFYSTNLYDDLNTSNNLYTYKWLNNNGNSPAIQLGSTAVGAINLNTWYKLRMAVHGSSINVYLNDVLKLQTSDTQWATGGVALFGGENMVANFAYARTRQYAATEPTVSVGPGTTTSGGVVVASLALNPINVVGGNSSQGTVTLSGPAPSGGAVITLTSSATVAAQVPASVTVAASATTANFSITTSAVAATTNSTITASYNGSSQTATLTVLPIKVSSLTLNPNSVAGGVSSQGTVTLSSAAPSGGISIILSSDNNAAQVPASVVLPANATSGVFTISTTSVTTQAVANIIASYNSSSQTAPLTIATASATYRSAITVANPGGTTLSNYQVHVVLGTSFDFTKAQANGADIRFTASDGVTGLPFWIESWNAAASSASLWVKVPTIDAVNGATLYMYYGNSTAVSASSGSSTFDFFDDFSSGLIDTTKWTSSGGTWSVVTGTEPNGLTGTMARGSTVRPPNEILYSSAYTAGDYIFEVNGLQQSGRAWGIGARVNGPLNFYSTNLYDDLNTSNNLYEYKWLNNNGNNSAIRLGSTAVGAINLNTWYKLRMAVHGPSIDVYLNDVLKLQTSDTQWATGGVALFGGENMIANFAYVRTRQYAATEPTASVAATPVALTTSQAIVSPGSLSFANQNPGTTSSSQAVILNNPGSQPLFISNINVSGDFLQNNNCPASLAPGLSCAVNVSFSPSTTGTRTGSLVFTDNAPSASQSVALSGNGGGVAIKVTLSPRTVAMNFTQTQQFTATVTGSSNTSVNWYVDNIAGGSAAAGAINAAGVYTPPAAVGTHTVTAISVADTTAAGSSTVYVSNSSGVLTYHNDNLRTGLNSSETVLKPSNVNSGQFGKLFALPVDGQIFAQPLYVPSLTIGSQIHNVVFVATEHDSIYAWDADSGSQTPLWQTSFINPGAGITAMPCGDAAGVGDCATITPEFGITGTPVIDGTTGTMYVVALTKEVSGTTTSYVYRLHALSTTTGAEKFGGPVVIQASASSSSGTIAFVPVRHLQRPGLVLVNGVVYIGFGSHGDFGPWYGWLLGYNASTLQPVLALNTEPNAGGGGVWQSGAGPAADSGGSVYFNTGNGTFDVNTGGVDYGDSVIKLSASGTVTDYFAPTNQAVYNSADNDIGAGGDMLLPDQSSGVPHVMITAGKPGVIYVLNRDNMGKYSSVSDNSLQSLAALTSGPSSGGLFGGPAFWNNFVYFNAWNDYLKAFQFNSATDTLTLSSNSLTKMAFPGATPSVSANGNSNGIVWIIQQNVPNNSVITNPPISVLRAFDATNVATELYNSSQASFNRDAGGGAVKFSVPTVADGRVYVPSSNQVTVYGLLP